MEESSLEKLRKRLYKPGEEFKGRYEEPELKYRPGKPQETWQEEQKPEKESKPPFPFFRFGLIAFFVLIVAFAGIFLFSFFRPAKFSAQNLKIDIHYPSEAKIGDLVKFEVIVKNENKTTLESADLIFDYPKDSKPLKETIGKRPYERRKLGGLRPAEELREIFEARIFGIPGEELSFKSSLEFRVESSSAILSKDASGSIKINESPLSVNIEAPKEIHSGQAIELRLNYLSNSSELFKDLVLKIDYPSGFNFRNSLPKSSALANNEWKIGDLSPAQKGAILINGDQEGINMEEKTFRAMLGKYEGGNFISYAEGVFTVLTKKSFLDLEITDGTLERIVSPGEIVRGEILFRNNLPTAVSNVTLELSFFGKAIDERSISSSRGSYRGIDKKLVWYPSSFGSLKQIFSGEEGKIDFQFKVIEELPVAASRDKNFTLKLAAKLSVAENPPEYKDADLSSEITAEFKVASPFEFSRSGFYYYPETALANSGPIPPRVGKKTTYTVIFSLKSPSDNIGNIEIRAPLPSYAEWENKFIIKDGEISFNRAASEIVIKIPKIEAGTGVIKPQKQIAFQIGVIPSAPQIGMPAVILSESAMSGFNEFTQKQVEKKLPALTTELREDEKLGNNDYAVKP